MELRGLGDSALPQNVLSTIASTIQQVEGYYPGSLAYINNNPGNLIYVGQSGASPGQGNVNSTPFAKFSSYQDGLNALYSQIQIYANQGLTITQMMQKYAPGDDPVNNPTSYAATIAAALGVTPDTLLTNIQYGLGTPDLSGVIQPVDDGSGDVTTGISMTVVIGAIAALLVVGLLVERR